MHPATPWTMALALGILTSGAAAQRPGLRVAAVTPGEAASGAVSIPGFRIAALDDPTNPAAEEQEESVGASSLDDLPAQRRLTVNPHGVHTAGPGHGGQLS